MAQLVKVFAIKAQGPELIPKNSHKMKKKKKRTNTSNVVIEHLVILVLGGRVR